MVLIKDIEPGGKVVTVLKLPEFQFCFVLFLTKCCFLSEKKNLGNMWHISFSYLVYIWRDSWATEISCQKKTYVLVYIICDSKAIMSIHLNLALYWLNRCCWNCIHMRAYLMHSIFRSHDMQMYFESANLNSY